MNRITDKPEGLSKNQINKVGKALRDGNPYDETIFDRFIEHHALLCDDVVGVVANSVNCLIQEYVPTESIAVEPGSGAYALSARVKTKATLVDKLRRMKTFPLGNILDVSGVRFDCDMTLSEQTELAKLFEKDLLAAGVAKVSRVDMREEPHSGYRAVHLHLESDGGKAELQVRTAMQAQWANLYEVAADIYGRSIRYIEFGEQISDEAEEEVKLLHEASKLAYKAEQLSDRFTRPFSGGAPGGAKDGLDQSAGRQIRSEVYGILEARLKHLTEVRSRMTAQGVGG